MEVGAPRSADSLPCHGLHNTCERRTGAWRQSFCAPVTTPNANSGFLPMVKRIRLSTFAPSAFFPRTSQTVVQQEPAETTGPVQFSAWTAPGSGALAFR